MPTVRQKEGNKKPNSLTIFVRFGMSKPIALKFHNLFSLILKCLHPGETCSVISGMSGHFTEEKDGQ
jgi:hypothetical protein